MGRTSGKCSKLNIDVVPLIVKAYLLKLRVVDVGPLSDKQRE